MDKVIRIQDRRYHLICDQGETEEAILFLHGFPECAYAWRQVIQFLSNGKSKWSLDLLGYGQSSRPDSEKFYHIESLVKDMRTIVQEIGKTPITIVGHDWGGIVAWHFLAEFPELVKKMISINSPHPLIYFERLKNCEEQKRASSYIDIFLADRGVEFCQKNDFRALKYNLFSNIDDNYKNVLINQWSEPTFLEAALRY